MVVEASWSAGRAGTTPQTIKTSQPEAIETRLGSEREPNSAWQTRLRALELLTILVPALCAGIYETVRHSVLTNDLSSGMGTLLAVIIVLGLSFAFARASFGIIRQMDARLRARNRRLLELSQDARRLATLEERDRLAREIHDGVAQVLATFLIRVDTIEALVQRDRGEAVLEELADLRRAGEIANVEVREAIAGLRTNPFTGGLNEAILTYSREFGTRVGVAMEVCAPVGAEAIEDDDLPHGAGLHVLRVVQEALTNVRKHANARSVRVATQIETTPTGREWSVEITDDGVGFVVDDVSETRRTGKRRYGLTMMRERVQAIGGRCDIISSPGGGTTVRVVVRAGQRGALEEFASANEGFGG